ncbi:MAG TPA: hypothetical protein PKK61_06690 [Defluviitaleaceae bacterium]|nr:hypothetical protein [Candidatus Epulonipiscium sp.]HOA80732.1 hypothetical protein [Defluviitaleaceae bacterium]
MKVNAVRKYKTPAYPTSSEFKHLPELAITKKWNENIIKSSLAVAMTAFLLNGCGYDLDGGEVLSGEIAAPYILTEEEAFKIIYEEANAAGINLKENSYTVKSLKLETDLDVIKDLYPNIDFNSLRTQEALELAYDKITFELDLYDEEKKVGIEYLHFTDEDLDVIDRYNLKELVNYSLKEHEADKYIKIFENEGYNNNREEAEEDLREQIQEFFEYLKAEGVI